MIRPSLISPASIVVVGASANTSKPGGKVVHNLLTHRFQGKLYAVNPRPLNIEGLHCVSDIRELPVVDLAIISIPAAQVVETVMLLLEKGVRSFIVYSGDFGESGQEGEERERILVTMVNNYGGTLIGPNCIGLITGSYKGVFTTPVPDYYSNGCELISSSGATAVFILEAAHTSGLRFSNIYSIGNAAQTGVEEFLEYMDATYQPGSSPNIKLCYLEDIRNPAKFLKHAASLVRKGCRMAAIKAGYSEAGSRAALSHTGALATPDRLVRALFKKAGIVYCESREELISVACVWQMKPLTGSNIAVITHAGGSAVMVTDTITSRGLFVPPLKESDSNQLASELHPGSTVNNPIDFLATGTAYQLARIIDYCEELDYIDGMIVVFGSPGLFDVTDAYQVLHQKSRTCTKPIYSVLPSLVNAGDAIRMFVEQGNVHFPYEVALGKALALSYTRPVPTDAETGEEQRSKSIRAQAGQGLINIRSGLQMLQSAGLPVADTWFCSDLKEVSHLASTLTYPVVAKLDSAMHKTDLGGVFLNIQDANELIHRSRELMGLTDDAGVQIQPMLGGHEFYFGVVRYPGYGHLIMCGLGGVFVEILNDVAFCLAPLSSHDAMGMIKSLQAAKVFDGYRNKPGISRELVAEILVKLSRLVIAVPEIAELDLNPVMIKGSTAYIVDARIVLV